MLPLAGSVAHGCVVVAGLSLSSKSGVAPWLVCAVRGGGCVEGGVRRGGSVEECVRGGGSVEGCVRGGGSVEEREEGQFNKEGERIFHQAYGLISKTSYLFFQFFVVFTSHHAGALVLH